MKIGIYTQPLRNNYGGLLQNYALQQVLIRLGHSPITIDYRPKENILWRYILSQFKTLLLLFISSRKRPFQKYNRVLSRSILIKEFVSKNIATTHRLQKIRKGIVKEYALEAVISGSDQVWRPIYNKKIEYSYLSFVKAKHVKKVAYAASFGVGCWEYTEPQTKMCSKLAKSFDAISVREHSGILLCKNYLNVDAIEVLDPTLLLEKEEYMSLCNEIPVSPGKLLIAYVLDMTASKQSFIERIGKEKNLEVKILRAEKNLTMSVEQWLCSFRDAEYVITDSFHGTVFSIIFRKPFISIVNLQRGNDRFVSLLSKFNLISRIIDIESKCEFEDSVIDWTYVEKQMRNEKKKSISFLLNSLQ